MSQAGVIVDTAAGAILTLTGDAGGAISPDGSGDIAVLGGTGISTTGTPNTITIDLDAPVAETNGGTGQSTYTTGDVLYSDGANSLAKLAIGSTNQVLTITGGVPVWANTQLANPTLSPACYNIGFSYSAGTFTVHDAVGAALSASNPGYLVLPSATSPGQRTVHEITANVTWQDDAGTSDIIGNLFGLTTGIAYASDIPFFLYAAPDSTDANPKFFISRVPHRTICPAEADIGAPDDAVADTQGSFWCFENITEANYEFQPCVRIGMFRMQMSASDDWTVQSLGDADGIGRDPGIQMFQVPTGAWGATAGGLLLANGGTAPAMTNNKMWYNINPDGLCNVYFTLDGDAGTDGAGAVSTEMVIPFKHENVLQANTFIGYGRVISSATGTDLALFQGAQNQNYSFIVIEQGTFIQNQNFGNGTRFIDGQLVYRISDS